MMKKILLYLKEHLWVLYIFALILGLIVRLITGRMLYALTAATFVPLLIAFLTVLLSIERKWPIVWGAIDAFCITVFVLCLKAIIFFTKAGY